MRYCGVVVGPEYQHLCRLEEVRAAEPPIRLRATFYEPGTVAEVLAELSATPDAVIAVAAPQSAPAEGERRACDTALLRRGVTPHPALDSGLDLFAGLESLGLFRPSVDAAAAPEGEEDAPVEAEGTVEEGAFRDAPVIEVNADGVFCALQARRVPAKRHPLGVLLRIDELVQDHVEDPGGELWHRRIEEIEAAACALAAHRYAVGHASWLGDPDEAVVVLPGARLPASFSAEGVIPPVPRVSLGSG